MKDTLKLFNCEQLSDEWHELRAKYPRTASRTSTVMGCSPFSNWEKLAQEIKFGIKPFYNKAMQLGNELEDMVREKANDILGDVFEPQVGVNAELLASLDGINFDGDTIIEIKVSKHTYNAVKSGEIPEYYKWQMYHQMNVFEAKKALLVAYNPETEDIAISDPLVDDANTFFQIINKWEEFEKFMETYELPEETVREDTEWEMVASRLVEINQRKKELEAEEKEYKTALLSMANGIKSKGFGVSVYPVKGRETIDYKKAIASEKIDIDLDKYKKQGKESWAVKVAS